jgi:hypothetical protein
MPSPSHIKKMIEIAVDIAKDDRYNVSFLFAKGSNYIDYANNLSKGKIYPVILEEFT